MAIWTHKLELKDLHQSFDNDEISIEDVADGVVNRINALMPSIPPYLQGELRNIRDDFAVVNDVESYDEALNDLYDWADTSLDGKFGGRKLCWVNTF